MKKQAKVTVSATPENNARVYALSQIDASQWKHSCDFADLQSALASVNLYALVNSGWYNPVSASFKGVEGIFMINESGSIFTEARIIKKSDKCFSVEKLLSSAYNKFDDDYRTYLNK